jgi:ribonuclease P protein component
MYLRNGPFRLYAVETDGDSARLGLIIGKRQAKRAVDRNRIKRILRETFRTHYDVLPPFDIVVQLAEPIREQAVLGTMAIELWSTFCSTYETEHAGQAEL